MIEPGPGRLPALYIGHGAPPLLEDPGWMGELTGWAAACRARKAILIVSAHWESAPVMLGATAPVPLVYDFYGFPRQYYRMTYDDATGAGAGAKVAAMMPDGEPVAQHPAAASTTAPGCR